MPFFDHDLVHETAAAVHHKYCPKACGRLQLFTSKERPPTFENTPGDSLFGRAFLLRLGVGASQVNYTRVTICLANQSRYAAFRRV